MSQTTLDKLLKSKSIPPCILLFGEEDFLCEEAFEKLIAQAGVDKSDQFAFSKLDGDSSNIQQLVDEILTVPMIPVERRIIAVTRFEKLCASKAKGVSYSRFEKSLSAIDEGTTLLLRGSLSEFDGITKQLNSKKDNEKAEKKLAQARSPFAVLFQKAEWVEFGRVFDSQITAWLTSRAKSRGVELSESANRMLQSQAGSGMRELANELEKVLLYSPDATSIELDHVAAVVGDSKEWNVFELQKAVGERNLASALDIAFHMMGSSNQAILITVMLGRYFTILWKAVEVANSPSQPAIMAGQLGISPFFVSEYLSALKRYSPAEIDRAIDCIAQADYQLKSSGEPPDIVLQRMFVRMMSK